MGLKLTIDVDAPPEQMVTLQRALTGVSSERLMADLEGRVLEALEDATGADELGVSITLP